MQRFYCEPCPTQILRLKSPRSRMPDCPTARLTSPSRQHRSIGSIRVGPQKLRRALRPGGWLAIWWMLFEDPTTHDAFDRAIQTVLGPSQSIVDPGPTALQIETDARCATLREAGFVEVRSEILRSVHTFDGTAIRALYATMAIVLRRPEPDQARVLDALQALVERDFDNLITRTFVTALYTAQSPTWVAP